MNLKLSLLLSLYYAAAFHHSYGMEKDEVYQKPSGTKQDSDNASMKRNNYHSNTSLDDSGLLVKAGLSNMMSSEILQKIKDLYYGRLDHIDINPLQIPHYEDLCLIGEDQDYYQSFLIDQGIIGRYENIIEHIKTRAEKGNSFAQNNLGMMYFYGMGIEKSYEKAIEWCTKAADQGYSIAQFSLGYIYRDGREGEKNPEEAVKWFRKAADQGFSAAQYNLGIMYIRGNGIEQNDVEAFKWYKKAADQGHAVSQYNVGLFYDEGLGVAQNHNEAFKWLVKAGAQNSEEIKDDIHDIKNRLQNIFLQNMDSFLKNPLLVRHIQALCEGYKLISDMGLKATEVLSTFQKVVTKISSPLSFPSDLMGHYETFVGAIDDIKQIVLSFQKQDKKTVRKIEEKIKALLDKAAQQKKSEDARIEQQRKQKEQEEKAALKKAKEQEKAQKKREEKAEKAKETGKAKVLKEQEQSVSAVFPQRPADSGIDLTPAPRISSDVVSYDSSASSAVHEVPRISAIESPVIAGSLSVVRSPDLTETKKDKQTLKEEKKKRALERTVSYSIITRPSSSGQVPSIKGAPTDSSSVPFSPASPRHLHRQQSKGSLFRQNPEASVFKENSSGSRVSSSGIYEPSVSSSESESQTEKGLTSHKRSLLERTYSQQTLIYKEIGGIRFYFKNKKTKDAFEALYEGDSFKEKMSELACNGHKTEGIGQKERLKHAPVYSLRIDKKRRLIYQINYDGSITILNCKGYHN